jgi:hypothetical protein
LSPIIENNHMSTLAIVSSALVVKPAQCALLFVVLSVVVEITIFQALFTTKSFPRLLALVFPTILALAYGFSFGLLLGVQDLLIRRRFVTKVLPASLFDKVSLTQKELNTYKNWSDHLFQFLHTPPFVPDHWLLLKLWQFALGFVIDIGMLNRLSLQLQGELEKTRGTLVNARALAEDVLLRLVGDRLAIYTWWLHVVGVSLMCLMWSGVMIVGHVIGYVLIAF